MLMLADDGRPRRQHQRGAGPDLVARLLEEHGAWRTEHEVRIPMRDGVELAATLYLPDDDRGPQPCLLEALPYRKDDLTSSYAESYRRLRDEFGYAVCRLDLRGTGSSAGDATDEYPAAEQADLVEVIAWLADSRGATATSACGARRTPASTRCRSPASGRRR